MSRRRRAEGVRGRVQEPDATVVRAAADGDPRAFERLVRECQGPLRRYLRHLVGDESLADDLAQDVFVKVHAGLHAFRAESRFTTWVFRIARNAALDDRRADARRRKREQRALVEPVLADPSAASEVAQAIASLTVDLREALLLVEVCGFSYAEVAALLGVPEGTAKSRVHRAREAVAAWYTQPRTRRR
jgi:RNA polymerase sigma-70 factor, ECF subfamily